MPKVKFLSPSLSSDRGRPILKVTKEVKCSLRREPRLTSRQAPDAWGDAAGHWSIPAATGHRAPAGSGRRSACQGRCGRPTHPSTPPFAAARDLEPQGTRSGHPEAGSPFRPTAATKGRVAAWPLSDSRHRKGRFASRTSGSEVAGTAPCNRGRSAPATPRDVADRTGANGPERAATDNMATAAPTTSSVTGTTFRSNAGPKRSGRRRICDVSATPEREFRKAKQGSPRWRRGYGRKLGAGQERAGPGANSPVADLVALPQENRSREEFPVVLIEILPLEQKLKSGTT